jgi:hypothetical protein
MQGVEPGAPLEERSLRELIGQLSRDGSLLLQQEVALAKQELTEKAKSVSTSAGAIAVGALVLYAGALTLIAGLVLALALALPAWLSAVVVGLVVTLVGGVLLARGKKSLENLDLKPKKTIASVKRDVEMMKEVVHDQT